MYGVVRGGVRRGERLPAGAGAAGGEGCGGRRGGDCQWGVAGSGAWQKGSEEERSDRHRGGGGRPSPPAPDGRAFHGVPGVLRPARGEFHDRHGTADQCDLRLRVDAREHAARRGAHAFRGGVRRLAQDLALGGVPRVQGEPFQDARRVQGPGRADRRAARRDARRAVRGRGLRGRRRHRHAHRRRPARRASRSRSSRATATPSSWSPTTSRCSTPPRASRS